MSATDLHQVIENISLPFELQLMVLWKALALDRRRKWFYTGFNSILVLVPLPAGFHFWSGPFCSSGHPVCVSTPGECSSVGASKTRGRQWHDKTYATRVPISNTGKLNLFSVHILRPKKNFWSKSIWKLVEWSPRKMGGFWHHILSNI